MKRRWLVYALVGVTFGVFDYYYQGLIAPWSGIAVHLFLVLGVWLIPVVPVALYETRATGSLWLSALAGVLTWFTAIVAYYLFNAIELLLLGVPRRPEMHVSNRDDPFFWQNWQSVLRYDILGGILEWSLVAILGGAIVGFLVSLVYRSIRRAHPGPEPG